MTEPFLIAVSVAEKRLLMEIKPTGRLSFRIFYLGGLVGELVLDAEYQPWAVYCTKEVIEDAHPQVSDHWSSQISGLLLNRQLVSTISQEISRAIHLNQDYPS